MLALFHYQFLQNALLAASVVAIVAAVVGYFLLARGLTFAGHALSHVGFAGAAAGLVAGVDPVFGLLTFTILGAIGIATFGKRLNERDVTIGIFLSTVLGLGALFISLYTGYAERAYSILFGTILGISRMDILITVAFSLITLLGMAVIFRPLLFASFDPEVAEARGVPVRWLSLIFLVLVAVTVSMAVQVVGILLIFTLLVGPAATSMRLTPDPKKAITLAVILGLIYSWLGILLAAGGNWPVSFYISALSFAIYLPVRLLATTQDRAERIET